MKNKKTVALRICLTALTALFIAWIYSNSLKNAEQSTAQSGKVLTALKNIFAFFFPESDVAISMRFVRKAAHFCEYALLGFLFFFTLKSYGVRTLITCVAAQIGSTVVAFSDEGLQFLSDGRAPALLDVFIDSAGALCGVAAALAAYALVRAIVQKQKKKQEKAV